MRRARRRLLRDARGVVMMEFLIALMPVMLAFLGLVQFSFAMVAKLVVRHAASTSARAAVVVIEESVDVLGTPDGIYQSLEAGELESMSSGNEEDPATSTSSGLGNAGSSVSGNSPASSQLSDLFGVLDRSESRMQQIRTAAYLPLLVVSPDAVSDGLDYLVGATQGSFLSGNDNVRTAIGDTGVSRMLGAFVYNLGAAAVTFPVAPGSDEYVEEPYAPGAPVTVRVTYLFRCRVPLVSFLMCESGWSLLTGSSLIDPGVYWEARYFGKGMPEDMTDLAGWQASVDSALAAYDAHQARVDAFDGKKAEFDQVESPTIQQLLLAMPGARYMTMQAEATLPLQGARYYRRSGS